MFTDQSLKMVTCLTELFIWSLKQNINIPGKCFITLGRTLYFETYMYYSTKSINFLHQNYPWVYMFFFYGGSFAQTSTELTYEQSDLSLTVCIICIIIT